MNKCNKCFIKVSKRRRYCDKCSRDKKLQSQIKWSRKHRKLSIQLKKKKCSICDWNGPCDRHRIKWGRFGGKYTKGNIMIVCLNCHRLIHRNILIIK